MTRIFILATTKVLFSQVNARPYSALHISAKDDRELKIML